MIQVYKIPNGDDESLHEFFNPVPSQSRMKRENWLKSLFSVPRGISKGFVLFMNSFKAWFDILQVEKKYEF